MTLISSKRKIKENQKSKSSTEIKLKCPTFSLSCFLTWYPLNPAWILVAASTSMLLLLTVALVRFSLSILCKSDGELRSELVAFGKTPLSGVCAGRTATPLTSATTRTGRGDVRASTPATCRRTVLLLEKLPLG